jgi:hypothetical protein
VGTILSILHEIVEVAGDSHGGDNLSSDSVLVEQWPGAGGVREIYGILGEELVVEAGIQSIMYLLLLVSLFAQKVVKPRLGTRTSGEG